MRCISILTAVLFFLCLTMSLSPAFSAKDALLSKDAQQLPEIGQDLVSTTGGESQGSDSGANAAATAVEADDKDGDAADEPDQIDVVKTGEILTSDPLSAARLEKFYCPVQDNPEYFSDRKCRKKIDLRSAEDLARYKPNFGKKIWIKSHFADTIEQNAADLGDLYASRTYKMSALEIEENVAPHLEAYLKDKNIDFQKWADAFEKWGRTYVDPSSGGKKRSTFIVKDYRNGNFLILKPRRGKQVCYFIAEKYQEIVNGMLAYTPLAEKKGKK